MSLDDHRGVNSRRVLVGPRLTPVDVQVIHELVLTARDGGVDPVLVVDLSEVDELDARGILTLIAVRRLATSRGVELVVEAAPQVAAQLAQLRLAHAFRVTEAATALTG